MKVLEIIENVYQTLTNREKLVANYFLEQKYQVVLQTLSEISTNVGVGEATVIRFCHKLGFKSFLEVRLMLDLENTKENRNLTNSYIDAIEKRVESSIRKSIELIDEEDLEKALQLIDEKEHLVTIGVAYSGISAQALAARFIRAGKLCHCIIDPHLQSMYSSWAGENSLLIVFSLSGRTKDTLAAMKLAKQNNVKTIAITNFRNSPVAKLADVTLLTLSLEGPLDSGSLTGIINQVFIADLLITGYLLLDRDKSLKIKEAALKAIGDKLLD